MENVPLEDYFPLRREFFSTYMLVSRSVAPTESELLR